MESYRSEYKHSINQSEYLALRSRLRAIFPRDAHANADGGYLVSSLYFDNADDKVLREKLSGLQKREKFRIRTYNHDPTVLHLEKKERLNGLSRKAFASISYAQYTRLLNGDYTFLAQCDQPLCRELHRRMQEQQLRPHTIVEYYREAFVYAPGNVRITLDSDIRSGMGVCDLFTASFPTLPVSSHSGLHLLEVKFDEFLPDLVRDAVQITNRQNTAFSKYAACRLIQL